jgi:hypothetical protein
MSPYGKLRPHPRLQQYIFVVQSWTTRSKQGDPSCVDTGQIDGALESGQDTYVDAYVDENDLNLAAFAVPAPGTFL